MMFLKRVFAYLIDCIILYFAVSLLNIFIPVSGDILEFNTRLTNLTDDYMSEKIAIEEYKKGVNDINYELSKATYISSIAGITVYILYFVVFQAYNNGQTLGKKLLKLQVVKDDGTSVDANSLLIRGLIPYGLLVNFILVIAILFASKSIYSGISNTLSNIHMIVIFVTLVMMMIKSKGIHDYLARTKVEKV